MALLVAPPIRRRGVAVPIVPVVGLAMGVALRDAALRVGPLTGAKAVRAHRMGLCISNLGDLLPSKHQSLPALSLPNGPALRAASCSLIYL